MLTIDRIKESDLADLICLYEELSGKKTDMRKLKESFHYIDSNPDYLLIAAKGDDGQLLGSLLGIICHDVVGECRPFMVLENVVVKSDFRGVGVGKELMNYIEDAACKNNCYYIMFVSSMDRKEAHAFYQSLGYSITAVQGFKKYL